MKKILGFLIVVFSVLAMVSCERDDDEPMPPTRAISRLYVSTSEFRVGEGPAYNNVFIVDPADGEDFDAVSMNYTSGALGGAGVLFSPELQRVLQASVNNRNDPDSAVQILTIDPLTGVLGQGGLVRNDLLTDIKGMAYHSDTDYLFLVNSSSTPYLYGYQRPRARNNPALPDAMVSMPDGSQPHAIMMRDLDLSDANKRNITYITTVEENGKILGYHELPNNLLNRLTDTLRTDITPNFTLTIAGGQNLLGMSYSPALDLLVVSDYNESNQGRILFFDNFSSYTSDTNLTPSRVISGGSTLLQNPVDVEIDGRDGAQYIYVADRLEKAVLRFRITDEGNIAPSGRLQIVSGSLIHTPVGISLDARGTLVEDEEEG